MKTVLVAEDNDVNRELVAEMLEAADYRVMHACDGEEAIAVLETTRPNIILLDMQMPKKDGMETLRAIREHHEWSSLPVIACTAFAMQGQREAALKAGFDEYISKPISMVGLLKTLALFDHGRP